MGPCRLCDDDWMDEPMTIDVWSDVICPFCCIGERQLLRAIERFEHRDQTVLRLRAYELDPRMRDYGERTLDELVALKYGISVEQAERQHRRLEGEAANWDMQWDLRIARPTNTFDAHRLIAEASDQDLGRAMAERLFRAYFVEGLIVSDLEVLGQLADDVGVRGATRLLQSDARADEVRADEADAMELGFAGVPAILIDRRFVVSGAQGPEVMLGALERAWAKRQIA